MKVKNFALITVGCIICCAFYKPIKPVTDYRDVYVGGYACKKYIEKLNSSTMTYSLDTGRITIYVSKDVTDSILLVSANGVLLKVKLSSGGNLLSQPVTRSYGGRFYGTGNIDIFYTPNKTLSSRYIGTKIEI
ncbi:MAG TPA: hypothetical protein VKG26_01675 [Bacteroidia bacterium]|nr:hypothetical protein [Bacteroidia bacterium]